MKLKNPVRILESYGYNKTYGAFMSTKSPAKTQEQNKAYLGRSGGWDH